MNNVQINNDSEREIIKIRRIFWMWHSDFIGLEGIARQGQWRADTLLLESGITPLPFNVDVTDWTIDEGGKNGPHGTAVPKTIEGMLYKWNEFCESYFNEMQRRRMVLFFEDFDGRTWIFGGESCKTSFTYTKTISPRAGYKMTFSNMSDESSIIINDTAYFPAPPNVSIAEVLAQTKDRYGIILPSKTLTTSDDHLSWDEYDFTDLMLSRESGWNGWETQIQAAMTALIAAGVRKNLIAWYPNIGGTAGCHRWNQVYPFDHNTAHRMLYSGMSHGVEGLKGFSGFSWAFPNVNVQSFTNSYDIAIGITLTSDLGTSLGATKNVFASAEITGVGADLSINTTNGNVTYWLYNASATYVPGAPEADYTGFRYVIKRQGTALKLFINGVLVQTTTPSFSLQVSSFTINSSIRFGGQGSANTALESTLGNIYIGTDISDANITIIDGIIDTLETAVR